jgi:hypothetical protein
MYENLRIGWRPRCYRGGKPDETGSAIGKNTAAGNLGLIPPTLIVAKP